MKLSQIPVKDLDLIAEKSDTTVAYLRELRGVRRTPSPKLAAKISEATGGLVTVLELLFPHNTAA